MGLFRHQGRVEDPCYEDTFTPVTPLPVPEWTPPVRSNLTSATIAGGAVAMMVASGIIWHQGRLKRQERTAPMAFFELTAIGPDGHAVAGVVVTNAGKAVGVTDSFGEWRRFLQVKLGSKVDLQLSKGSGEGALAAVKELTLPSELPAAGDLEVKARVELSRVKVLSQAPRSRKNQPLAR